MSTPEERLSALGLALPPVPEPLATYVPFRIAGDMLYVSGQGPRMEDGSYQVGRLGFDTTVEQGYEAARLTGLHLLAVARQAVGDLSRIKRRTLVVQCANDIIAAEQVGEYVHAQVRDSKLVYLEASGHCPNLSAPDEVIAAIRDFA